MLQLTAHTPPGARQSILLSFQPGYGPQRKMPGTRAGQLQLTFEVGSVSCEPESCGSRGLAVSYEVAR